jgi:DNA repair exonuclease SbcCD ATPase subunit
MKEVRFKSVDIEGFGAIQSPLHFDFIHPGINVIRGMNGTCKTTVFNAPFWCLYGVNLKGVTKERVSTWPHVRTDTYRGTRVVTTYETDGMEYQVARHIGFKGKTGEHTGGDTMMVFIDGELKSTGINDSTKLVEDSLGLNSKMFLNSVLFGQRMKKLIEADDEEKRKVFEELFNAEWVKGAREKAVKQVNEIKGGITENTNILALSQGKLESYQEMITSLENARDSFSRDKDIAFAELQRNLIDAQNNLSRVAQSLKTDFNGISEEGLDDKVVELEESETKIQILNKSITEITQEINGLKTSLALTEKEKNNLQQRLKEYNVDQLNFIQTKGNTLKSCNEKLASDRLSLEEYRVKLLNLQSKLDMLRQSGVDLSVEDKIKDNALHINAVTLDLNRLVKHLGELDKERIQKEGELNRYQIGLTKNVCFNCGKPLDDNKSTVEAIATAQEQLTNIQLEQKEEKELQDKKGKELSTLSQEKESLALLLPQLKNFKGLELELQNITHSQILLQERIDAGISAIAKVEAQTWDKQPPCTEKDIAQRTKELTRLSPLIEDKAKVSDGYYATMSQYSNAKSTMDQEIKQYRSQLKEKGIKEQDQKTILSTISSIKKQIEALESSVFTLGDKLTETQALHEVVSREILALTTTVEEKSTELDKYTYWVDAFGANGVKAFIFEAMLTLLNQAMETYAQQLGVRVRFVMDLNSARKGVITQCYKDGGIVLYDELSGGEKQRVDIVQVFGTHDVVSGKVGFNILLMDEIFENLDAEGVDAVFDLIRMKLTEDRSIYIITHLAEINTMFARVINFTREGITVNVN